MNIAKINSTVWGHLESDITPDNSESLDHIVELQLAQAGVFEDIERVFAQKPVANIQINRRKERVQVLDSKKAYNLNIFITSMTKKIPFESIRPGLLHMDNYFDDEQILSNLLKFLPTPEETGKLATYTNASPGELLDLSPPDKFCLEMMKIPRLKERIENMLFRATFWERYQQLHQQMTAVFDASLSLKHARNFKKLLHLILLLGNFLNGQTYRGGAFGFKIASINKLIDTKGATSSTTLLHFLVDIVEQNFPIISDFLEELEDCGKAYKVPRTEINNEFRELESGLEALEKELKQHQDNIDSSDLFGEVMERFYLEATIEFNRVYLLRDKMNESYEQVVRFYGEDSVTMPPDEFFGIFKTFTTTWEKCSMDSKLERQKQERMEKQKIRDIERRTRARSGSMAKFKGVDTNNYASADQEKSIMDSLMEKLRAGNLEAKTRRKSERGRRQRSVSIHSLQTVDSVTLRAQRMLNSIQNDGDLSLAALTAATTPTTMNAITSSVTIGSEKHHHYNNKELRVSIKHDSGTERGPVSAPMVPPLEYSLLTPLTAPPISAAQSMASVQARPSQSTRVPRTRKTSKRPPLFERNLRSVARRSTISKGSAIEE
ncbi:hypothetical protein [Absidia glauca]|uniref:FH2 domain-containing protein n=1 Tax=Absidia glauca TaxID=4829 RepID=A0A168NSQ3_ABSGL|nr:hypothetical protein [Absidia glauca]